jgi:hypothetical protein
MSCFGNTNTKCGNATNTSPAFGLREANLKNKEEISTKTAMQERF